MTSDESSQPAANVPVGQQLQRARDNKGLSANDVANAQHLRPAVIQAIEAGDYDQIDSELFLKGYVRAYARQVDLDANAVIKDLERELEPLRQQREQEFEANPLVDIERRRLRKRRVAKFALVLSAAALASYLMYAFVLPQTEPMAPADSIEEAAPEDLEAAVPEAQSATADSAIEEPVPQETSAPATEEGASTTAGSAIAESPEPEDSTELTAPAADAVSDEETVDLVETAPVVTQSTEPVVDDPAEPVVVADTGRLQITFTGDCWVQISDATGNRLVNSLQRDGDRVDVSGEVPFKVVIGAVDAVGSISFQGEPVDIGGYRVVNNRSEFTLAI